MAGEREAADLAAVKAREARIRANIRDGDSVVDTGPFGAEQLGLHLVVADEWGRMWRVDGPKLTLIFAPGRCLWAYQSQ